jgi:nucleoredoxin
VSADHDSEGFEEYFGGMPWTAVPFATEQREAIPDKFQVQGIPRVVVLRGADGSVVNNDARGLITDKKKLNGVF